MLAALVGQCRHTLTNLLCIGGTQRQDWSADYRLYSKDRVDDATLFGHARDRVIENLPAGHPLVVALDDTIVRKSSKKTYGVGWKRDPLGPPFQTNLVLAQRYLQFSAAWPLGDGRARMVPVDFQHAPSPAKPKRNAQDPEHEMATYKEALKQQNLNKISLSRIEALRNETPQQRQLIFSGDGSFTNQVILRNLPAKCTYIGRGRKDMALHYPPEPKAENAVKKSAGRPTRYGAQAPTPEELRQDDTHQWQEIRAFAAGSYHQFKIKTLAPVLWRKTGVGLPLRIVVIAPLGYRLTKGGRMLYRKPAYLVCTDPDLSLEELVQYYLWRWGIEVNFREEKDLLGTGQAQVRTESSTQRLPATIVAAYSLLWTSTLTQIGKHRLPPSLALPKWRRPKAIEGENEVILPSTGELLRILRHELWSGSIRAGNYSDFVSSQSENTKCQKPEMNLAAQLFSVA